MRVAIFHFYCALLQLLELTGSGSQWYRQALSSGLRCPTCCVFGRWRCMWFVGSARRTDVIPSTCFEAKKKPADRYVSPVGASCIRPGQLSKSSIVWSSRRPTHLDVVAIRSGAARSCLLRRRCCVVFVADSVCAGRSSQRKLSSRSSAVFSVVEQYPTPIRRAVHSSNRPAVLLFSIVYFDSPFVASVYCVTIDTVVSVCLHIQQQHFIFSLC